MTHDDLADLRADARSARLAQLEAATERAAGNDHDNWPVGAGKLGQFYHQGFFRRRFD